VRRASGRYVTWSFVCGSGDSSVRPPCQGVGAAWWSAEERPSARTLGLGVLGLLREVRTSALAEPLLIVSHTLVSGSRSPGETARAWAHR